MTGGRSGIGPAGSSPPLHLRHREDEWICVLDGQLTIRCGEDSLSAGPADLPPDVRMLREVGERYGLEFVGPPLSAARQA